MSQETVVAAEVHKPQGPEGSKKELWRSILQEQKASGLSAAEFCRQRGLNVARFYWWKSNLSKRGAQAAKGRGGKLVPVHVKAAPADSRFEIVLGGATIRLPQTFDPQALKSLLSVVRSSC